VHHADLRNISSIAGIVYQQLRSCVCCSHLCPSLDTKAANKLALERQDLSRMYLAHYELESVAIMIIIISIGIIIVIIIIIIIVIIIIIIVITIIINVIIIIIRLYVYCYENCHCYCHKTS